MLSYQKGKLRRLNVVKHIPLLRTRRTQMPLELLAAAKNSQKVLHGGLKTLEKDPDVQESLQAKLATYDESKPLETGCEEFHGNPVLQATGGTLDGNDNTFEKKQGDFLPEEDISTYYSQGFVKRKFTLKDESDCKARILMEYNEHKEKCNQGIYGKACAKLPDYVGHLFIPSVIRLLKENYKMIMSQASSILNVPEEELFFSVSPFIVGPDRSGINLHQDYSYFTSDQQNEQITTKKINFHVSLINDHTSRLFLFPETHREIIHNLNAIKYLDDHGVPYDKELAKFVRCATEYLVESDCLPYEGNEALHLHMPHVTRYFQELYVQHKYADQNIQGVGVKTEPGEYVIFDPAIQHANGSTGEFNQFSFFTESEELNKTEVPRFSLTIRVLHQPDAKGNLLWYSATEQTAALQGFFDKRCEQNGAEPFTLDTGSETFQTVLCNNQMNDPRFISIDQMYQYHLRSGAYGLLACKTEEQGQEQDIVEDNKSTSTKVYGNTGTG